MISCIRCETYGQTFAMSDSLIRCQVTGEMLQRSSHCIENPLTCRLNAHLLRDPVHLEFSGCRIVGIRVCTDRYIIHFDTCQRFRQAITFCGLQLERQISSMQDRGNHGRFSLQTCQGELDFIMTVIYPMSRQLQITLHGLDNQLSCAGIIGIVGPSGQVILPLLQGNTSG